MYGYTPNSDEKLNTESCSLNQCNQCWVRRWSLRMCGTRTPQRKWGCLSTFPCAVPCLSDEEAPRGAVVGVLGQPWGMVLLPLRQKSPFQCLLRSGRGSNDSQQLRTLGQGLWKKIFGRNYGRANFKPSRQLLWALARYMGNCPSMKLKSLWRGLACNFSECLV